MCMWLFWELWGNALPCANDDRPNGGHMARSDTSRLKSAFENHFET